MQVRLGTLRAMFLNWAETEIYIEHHFWKKFEKLSEMMQESLKYQR